MKNLKFSTKGRICFACLHEIYILIFFASGRSVVWLARLLWEQEAESSNLSVPTIPTALNNDRPGSYRKS
jgi:hypothetical protein